MNSSSQEIPNATTNHHPAETQPPPPIFKEYYTGDERRINGSISARYRGGVTDFPEASSSPSSTAASFMSSAYAAGDPPHRNAVEAETGGSGLLLSLRSLNLQAETARSQSAAVTTAPISTWHFMSDSMTASPLRCGCSLRPSPVDHSRRPPSVNYNSMGSWGFDRQSQYAPMTYSNPLHPTRLMNDAGSVSYGQIIPNGRQDEDSSFEARLRSQQYGFGFNHNTQGLPNSRGSSYEVIGQQQYRSPVFNGRANTPASSVRVRPPMMAAASLFDMGGSIIHLAKDQYGCQFLQRKIAEGNGCVIDTIFNEVVNNSCELMDHPSGNYLMQKLIDVCREQQRMHLILVLTKEPLELIRISLNQHGTRAVQKLIGNLQNRQEAALVVKALKPGVLKLIKDQDGHHVILTFLAYFTLDDNKFIFDTVARNCVDIAVHRSGCRVLQSCLNKSRRHQATILEEISNNGLLLALDPFGNYVVQVILGLNNPFANANFASQFEGNYVTLSKDKHGSNVVEKCIEVFGDHDRANIILELISVPKFEEILQDQFANYVIQRALQNIKGPLNAALIEAIRPHSVLKTSPYCKRIFSRTSLRN